jgi:hypothetical protein
MDLRPELGPPALDDAKVTRLAKIASKLDGYNAYDDELDELLRAFNDEAGTAFDLEAFQKIYCSEDHEDWVRRIFYKRVVATRPELSRLEMAEVVRRVSRCDAESDYYLELFLENCKHPSETDLIYWPNLVPELPQDREPTAEEIADLAIRGSAEPQVPKSGS